jgi:hypothetical protein
MSIAQLNEGGGSVSALNITTPSVIKASPGRIVKVIVVASNASGPVTLNDCAITANVAAANLIFTIAQSTAAGTVINLEWPCDVGITINGGSSSLGGGTFAIAYF